MKCPYCDSDLKLESKITVAGDSFPNPDEEIIEVALSCDGDDGRGWCTYENFTFLVPDENHQTLIPWSNKPVQ